MKKLFLTTVVALFSLAASAQFLVATEISKTTNDDGEENYSIEGLTNNMSFGYQVMDNIIIGISMKDATMNTAAIIEVIEVIAVDAADAVIAVDGNDGLDGIAGTADDVAAIDAVDAVDAVEGVTGVTGVDEVEDGTIVADMQVFVRYAISDDMFLQVMTPMKSDIEGVNANDLMRVGAGYSFNVWGDVNAEFTYSMKVNGGDDGDRNGKMGIGVSMTF